MPAATAPRGDARTYLIHFVRGGLADKRYISKANGEIVPVQSDGPARKGRRKVRGTVVSLKALEEMRPARARSSSRRGSNCGIAGCNCGAGAASVSSPTAASAADRPARPDVLPARRGPPPAWSPPAVFHPPIQSSR